jgi:DHA1 family tetracycline resistance protein-like MFS transporter
MVGVKFVNGLFGSWGILFVVVQAYLADLVPAENRTTVFTHLEAAVISAFVIGPTLGGFLSRWFDSGVVGVLQVSLVLRILCFCYFVFFIKESMAPETIAATRQKLTIKGMVRRTVTSTFAIFYEKQSWNRVILLLVIFSTGIHLGSGSCFFLWTAYKFKWDSYLHGIYQLTLSVSRLTWMLILSLKVFSRSTRGEVWLLQTALFVMFFSYVVIGSIAESWVVFAMAAVHGLGILAKPTVQGLLSRSVAPDQQGSLFSGLQVTQQIGLFSASILFPNIWAVTVGTPYSSTFLFVEAGVRSLLRIGG